MGIWAYIQAFTSCEMFKKFKAWASLIEWGHVGPIIFLLPPPKKKKDQKNENKRENREAYLVLNPASGAAVNNLKVNALSSTAAVNCASTYLSEEGQRK